MYATNCQNSSSVKLSILYKTDLLKETVFLRKLTDKLNKDYCSVEGNYNQDNE